MGLITPVWLLAYKGVKLCICFSRCPLHVSLITASVLVADCDLWHCYPNFHFPEGDLTSPVTHTRRKRERERERERERKRERERAALCRSFTSDCVNNTFYFQF